MKRILTLALLFGVALLASSCKKEVTQVIQPNQTIVFTVKAADWKLKSDNKTWYATLDVPEIDNYFQENGGVLVYASFDQGIYEQIPEVYQSIAYSFSHTRGGIEIDAQTSDYTDDLTQPGDVKIKVVLIDSVP